MGEIKKVRMGGGGNGGQVVPLYISKSFRLDGTAPATAGNWGGAFYIEAEDALELVSVREVHGTAGNDAGAVTAMLTKAASGVALASGTDMLASGLNLKSTADTVQSGTLHATAANTRLAVGDRVGFVLTGTPTALAKVCIETVWRRI